LPGLITIKKNLQTLDFWEITQTKVVLFDTGQSGYLSVIQRIMKRAINFMGNFQGGKRSPVSGKKKTKLSKKLPRENKNLKNTTYSKQISYS
jgi:hypothetical protein